MKKAEDANAYYNKQPAKMNLYDAGESVKDMPIKKTEESHKQCSPGEFGMHKAGNNNAALLALLKKWEAGGGGRSAYPISNNASSMRPLPPELAAALQAHMKLPKTTQPDELDAAETMMNLEGTLGGQRPAPAMNKTGARSTIGAVTQKRATHMNAFQFGQMVKTALDMDALGNIGGAAGGLGLAGAGLGGLYGAVSGAMQAEKGKRLRGALGGAGRGALGGGLIGAGAGVGFGLLGEEGAHDQSRQSRFYDSAKHSVPDFTERNHILNQFYGVEDELQKTRQNLGLVGGGAAGAGLAALLARKKKDKKEKPTA